MRTDITTKDINVEENLNNDINIYKNTLNEILKIKGV